MAAFIIASNKVLQALALRRPSNEQELLLVRGVGKGKTTLYGDAWLEIIAQFEAEQKQRTDHVLKPELGDQNVNEDLPRTKQEDDDPKRRKIVHVGCSKEILLPSDELPPVLSTGLSFQFSEANVINEPSALSQLEDPDKSDDGSVFGPPMELPSSPVLKRKRGIIALPLDADTQQSSTEGISQAAVHLSSCTLL
jgi:hypothetical protein